MRHNHSGRKTITVERISVTTIRRQGSQKFYCEICRREIEASEGPQLAGQPVELSGEGSEIEIQLTNKGEIK